MQNKLAKILFSTRLTGFLFLVFAAAMITGTFLDSGQDTSPTPYTRQLIYNAWWFEAILVIFVINFIGNIFRYQLHKKEKWATLVLHLAFIFILFGAFITRYISFEGMMHIREGATKNTFLSLKTYITTYVDGDYVVNGTAQRRVLEHEVDFSKRLDNDFEFESDYNGQPVSVELEKFIAGAEEDIIPDDHGEEYLKLVEAGGGGAHNHFLKVGQVANVHNILIALNKPTEGAINITYTDDGLTIQSPFEGEYMTMATQAQGKLVKDSIQPLVLRSLYKIGNMQMVFPKPVVKGVFDVVQKSEILKNDDNGIVLKVTANGETKRIGLLGGIGTDRAFKQIKVGGLDFAFKYGAKTLKLPFSIKCNDFVAERYPGTEQRFSAFSSEVTVFDEEEGDFDYKIYMNNILNHRGYRFFQSNFDPDEQGTILSVNHDYWGTLITYIGYFLLFFGLLAILFTKNTRFSDLNKQLQKIKEKKSKLLSVVFVFLSFTAFSQSPSENHDHKHSKVLKAQIDSVLRVNITPKEHADAFGHLVIQDVSGRMMPVDTYASEMLRKLSKHETYEDFSANQVFLSIQESPRLWYNVPLIYLAKGKADSIRKIIGVEKDQKYAALTDFLTERGEYKLSPYLGDAYKTQVPNGYQIQFKETDQRVSLLFSALEGMALKIFPIPNDSNNKWISAYDFKYENHQVSDSLYANFIKNGFKAYLFTLNEAKRSGDFSEASKLLAAFKKTQHQYGSEVMLTDDKIETEILYNRYDIFKKLFSWYMYAGSLLFIVLIIQIFKSNNRAIDITVKVLKIALVALFLVHMAGLIVRWYISGHAPWSDAYESMIYLAWATMLFGFIFGRKSDLTIAATAFVTSMILMIAHWNWLDPAIANLQPVLNSYWLMIHVAVIVGSYGPLTLGMILGVVSLLLMTFTTTKNKEKMLLNIKELTIINEMTLTVGLVMLTIGNFLGGMWANESWGRYWGWDPKETWALITIMIYAFIIHMRLIPGLRGRWFFNLCSILGYPFMVFTYYGVNFYLAGLHSYQSGQEASYSIIGVCAIVVAIIGFLGYRGHVKHYRK